MTAAPHVPDLGSSVAAVLTGAWRCPAPAAPVSSADLAALVPRLLCAGAGGLAWWRLRASAVPPAATRGLRGAYRQQVITTALYCDHLAKATTLLRRAGVEPLLVKGWSVARLYPDIGLRPCGDIDLCVPPDQLAAAITALAGVDPAASVDLHAGVADLDDRTWDEAFLRSRLVRLGDTDIRILGAEDQLRHLCLHLMRHGAWRPLWLCDVAVVLDSLPPQFDWDYCLAGDRRLTRWVLCAIGLACRLLDARVHDPAVAARARRLPRWLPETVLALWGREHSPHFSPLRTYLRRPLGLWRFLHDRWRRNPIEILVHCRARPFYRLPPPAVRAVAFLLRARTGAMRRLGPRPASAHPAAGLPFDIHPRPAA